MGDKGFELRKNHLVVLARRRGHTMSEELTQNPHRQNAWGAHCPVCGAGVWVEYLPILGGWNGGGTAVRRTCEGILRSKQRRQQKKVKKVAPVVARRENTLHVIPTIPEFGGHSGPGWRELKVVVVDLREDIRRVDRISLLHADIVTTIDMEVLKNKFGTCNHTLFQAIRAACPDRKETP